MLKFKTALLISLALPFALLAEQVPGPNGVDPNATVFGVNPASALN